MTFESAVKTDGGLLGYSNSMGESEIQFFNKPQHICRNQETCHVAAYSFSFPPLCFASEFWGTGTENRGWERLACKIYPDACWNLHVWIDTVR